MSRSEELAGERTQLMKGHVPALDGLRCLAVGGVLFFHLHLPMSALGWTGVWLFFVLSGFLITGSLLESKKASNYFGMFYARRALRIFPIYYLALVLLAVVALVEGETVADWPYYVTYMQNFVLVKTGFNAKFPATFGHTWSLAIEEQFYLLWPFVVRFTSMRRLATISLGLVVVAPIARLVCVLAGANVYYQNALLVTQIDALAIGALLACLIRSDIEVRRMIAIGKWMVVAGAASTIAFVLYKGGLNQFWTPAGYLDDASGTLFFTALDVLFGGVVLVAVLADRGLMPASKLANAARWALTRSPVVYVGRVSYGVYLYHIIVWHFVGRAVHHWFVPKAAHERLAIMVLDLAATLLVAGVSWAWLERPLQALKARFGPKYDRTR